MTNMKATKRALLSSALALFLCCAMLIGTTFAWFTDKVESKNNIIKAGNLDIELYYQVEGQTDWTKVTSTTNVFKENALWEPGHTEVIKLKVVNEGSLALKYQLGVNVASEVGSINVNNEEFKLSDFIKFGIVDGAQTYTRDQAIAAVDATATTLKTAYNSGTTALEAKNDGDTDEKIVTMVVYMPTTVGNEANAKAGAAVPTINLGINLYATQLAAEQDSFGKDYDEDAWGEGFKVTTAGDLQAAINNGVTNIVLTNDITLNESIVIPAPGATTVNVATTAEANTNAVVIDLNGKEIIGTEGRDKDNNRIHVIVNNGNAVIKNGTVKSAGNDGGSAIYNNAGATLTLEDVTLYGAPQSDPVYEAGVSKPFPSYAVNNYGNAVVNGATIKSYHGAIATGGDGVTVINDADIDVGLGQSTGITSYAIYSFDNAQVTVNGGKFAFTKQEIYVNGGNTFCEYGTNPIIINGGNYINTSFSTGADREYVIKGGTFDADVSTYVADGLKAVENNGKYVVVSGSVDNVVTSVDQLQKALDEATDDAMIVIAADINGDVIVNQKEGVNITIDGANYDYDGVISIYGHARHTGVETLTIKNIDFVTNSDVELRYYIDSNWTDEARRYAHNVTIDNCTFTNNGNGTVVPARFRQAYNITMKDCEVYNTFSPFWCTGVQGLTIDTVTANCANEGITAASSNNVLIENCTITVPGTDSFGIRTDATDNYKLTVNNCKLNVATPIVIRGSSETYTVIVDGMQCALNADQLVAAINAGAKAVILAEGDYALRFTNNTNFNLNDMTIKGLGNVNLAISSSECWYGRVQGSNVTFENIHFTSSVGATGKATYNNCTFDDWAICASSNKEETTFNNCTINGCLNTSTDFSSGDVFVNNCEIVKAEYSGSMTMNFVDCQIDEIIIWNANTNLTNCEVTKLDDSNVTTATVTRK